MADSPGVLLPKPTEVFVGPLLRFSTEDVGAGIKVFDKWLHTISDGFITLERLKTVASAVPVVSNILSAVDLALDIKDMIEHHQQGHNPDLFDWVNLALDLIGIIPIPPDMAEFRMGGRPIMKMIREELAKAGKTVAEASVQMIEGAVMQAVIDSLSEQFAGKIQSFVDGMKKYLDAMLKTCAEHIEKIMNGFAEVFEKVAGDASFSVAGNIRAAGQHAEEVSAGFAAYDARKVASGYWHFLVDGAKIVVKEGLNAGSATAKVLDLHYQQVFRDMAGLLRRMVPTVKQHILEMGGTDFGKIGFLINFFQTVIDKKRAILAEKRLHASGVKPHGTTKVSHEEGEGRVDSLRHTDEAQHPGASDCKTHCPIPSPAAASIHSVGFALGDERLSHEDFVLPGAMPVSWTRTYRSFFDANDKNGELGARWITAYTTRIDIHTAELVYHDATGRSVKYPLLAPGDAHDDQGEGLTLLRLDEQWLTLTRGHELLQTYEKHGSVFRLAFVKDRAGNQVTLDYDQQQRLHRLITPHAIVAFAHDDRGRIIEAVHHDVAGKRMGTLARYTYSSDGDLVAATDRYDNRREYVYRHHLITRYTDRTGRGMNLEWNGTGPKAKCVHEYADDGSHEIRLAWHPDFRRVSVTDGLSNVTQHYYDRDGYTFRIVHPGGQEEWMYRDANHNLTQHTYPDGSIERMAYDARSNLVRHTRRDGSVVEMAYDGKEQMVCLTDPQGHAWKRQYDDAGNVTAEINPLGHTTKYSYNKQGLPTEVTDAKGGSKLLVYNEVGQLTAHTDCSGKTTKWSYDAEGRLLEMKDAAGGATAYQYGSNGYPNEIVSAAGIVQLQSDAEGRVLVQHDPMGRTTRYAYDGAGRIASRVDALGQTLGYGYDRLGRLTRLTDANHASYQFQYDSVGRLLETTGFDGVVTRYGYAADSGKLSTIDEAGRTTQIEVDRESRITRRVSGQAEERFAYDAMGRLIDAQNAYSRVQHFFDPAGNLVREHHAYNLFGVQRSYVWHHNYDELGVRVRTVRPDGHAIDWLTYGSGQVHGMALDGEERVQFERDNLHREIERTLPSKITQRTIYDAAGRMQRQAIQRENAPAPLATRRYTYDAVGQLTNIEDSRKGLTDYRYDPVGRLIESIGPAGAERFAFDPASNLLDSGHPQQARSRAPASPVRPESTLPPEVPRVLGNLLRAYAGTHFEYDGYGNLIEKRSPDGVRHLEWDAFNRLIAARTERSMHRTEARYFYDAFGRRIAREVDGERTVFGWSGDTLAYESNEVRSTHFVYEARSFVPLAQYVGAPVEGMPTPVHSEHERYTPEDDPLQHVPVPASDVYLFHYHCDQIGTPQILTDDLGDVVWEATYKAWGSTRELIARVSRSAGVVPHNPIRFQGQQVDEETGLHYNRHRYYDSDIGRFISKDPIGLAGGINIYRYAPNPVGWVDPLGLSCCNCLYRGVSAKHPAIEDANQGIVRPADATANLTPEQHAEGGLTGESQYVSWTPDKDLALSHANKDGPGGVLLSVPVGAPGPNDSWSWGWTHLNQWGEPEMLQEGTRTGVNVSREGCK